ncbi:MAG: insulinase family protein [Candidatus Liptonbacteria bacterium]|nr:insulinase family protein [Candidatus Liptonbacteria bacterium]
MTIKKFTLPNRLRVVVVPQPAAPTATALILVRAGSEYETAQINGISHFLEHMMFKGTAKRPGANMISTELDALGAEYNAFTSQEHTGYWVKVEGHKLARAFELLSDLYLHPVFDPQEIERERGVIIEEINMYADTPMRRVHDLFTRLLYGDQPAGWDIAGTKAIVQYLQREDFVAYRDLRYVAPTTVVVLAGKVTVPEARRLLGRYFRELSNRSAPAKVKTRDRQSRPGLLLHYKKSDQSHLVLGVRTFSLFDPRRHVLQVLAEVLGGGMSSRLFRKVRQEMGAAYYIRAGADLALDHGSLVVSAGVDNRKIVPAVQTILAELRTLAKIPVAAAELQKAKDHMIGNFLINLETSDELASFYGGQEILIRKLISPAEMVRRVRAVTSDQVRQVARQICRDRILNLAVIGPFRNPKPFQSRLHF